MESIDRSGKDSQTTDVPRRNGGIYRQKWKGLIDNLCSQKAGWNLQTEVERTHRQPMFLEGTMESIDRSGKDSQTTYVPRRNDGLYYYYSSGVKWSRNEADQSASLNVEVRMNAAIHPHPHTHSWNAQGLCYKL